MNKFEVVSQIDLANKNVYFAQKIGFSNTVKAKYVLSFQTPLATTGYNWKCECQSENATSDLSWVKINFTVNGKILNTMQYVVAIVQTVI